MFRCFIFYILHLIVEMFLYKYKHFKICAKGQFPMGPHTDKSTNLLSLCHIVRLNVFVLRIVKKERTLIMLDCGRGV